MLGALAGLLVTSFVGDFVYHRQKCQLGQLVKDWPADVLQNLLCARCVVHVENKPCSSPLYASVWEDVCLGVCGVLLHCEHVCTTSIQEMSVLVFVVFCYIVNMCVPLQFR